MVIELSGVQFGLKSYAWFHPFWNRPSTGLGQFNAVLSWFEIKFIHFWGEKIRVLDTKVAKFASWYSLSLIFLQFDWLFSVDLEIWLVVLFLVKPPHWLGKRCDLKQKMVWFKNKSHQLEPIRLQGLTVISKWV